MFTATVRFSGQVAAVKQARRMTQAPICEIKPISSATGMNSVGVITSPSSVCKRSSTSKPSSFLPSATTMGWKWRSNDSVE